MLALLFTAILAVAHIASPQAELSVITTSSNLSASHVVLPARAHPSFYVTTERGSGE